MRSSIISFLNINCGEYAEIMVSFSPISEIRPSYF